MSNIEVVNLERGERYDGADRPLAPFVSGAGHVVYAPWDAAEREVKARALRSLAARQTPPDGVAFVRTWEAAPPVVLSAEQMRAIDAEVKEGYDRAVARVAEESVPKPRGRRGR